MNMQGRVFGEERQGHDQTGDQLRAAFAGNAGLAGKQRALDGEGHVDFGGGGERSQDRSETGHDFGGSFQRSGRKGSTAINFYLIAVSQSCGERDQEAGQQA